MNKQQGFLLFVLLVAGFASLWIILPILQFILMSIILAYVLYPANRYLEPYLGQRLTPAVVIIGAVVLILLPLGYIGYVIYRDLSSIAAAGPELDVEAVETWIEDYTGQSISLAGVFEDFGMGLLEVLFGDIAGILSTLAFLGIGLALLVFVLYYILRDGGEAIDWLVDVMPVEERVGRRLTHQIDKTTYGVIVGHLLVAIIEGILGGIAFWIVGIPNVFFWAFVMVLASLLPILGPFLIWGPAVGYLVLIDALPGAVFLLLWGLIVIGLVDNWVRPILVDREAHLNPALILIGVFGGIYAIGASGLFVGPIILGVLVAALRVFDEEWDSVGGADST